MTPDNHLIEILDVTIETFRGEIIGKTFLFADDTSVSIDIYTNEVYDMDGIGSVSKAKKKAIENKINRKITI